MSHSEASWGRNWILLGLVALKELSFKRNLRLFLLWLRETRVVRHKLLLLFPFRAQEPLSGTEAPDMSQEASLSVLWLPVSLPSAPHSHREVGGSGSGPGFRAQVHGSWLCEPTVSSLGFQSVPWGSLTPTFGGCCEGDIT